MQQSSTSEQQITAAGAWWVLLKEERQGKGRRGTRIADDYGQRLCAFKMLGYRPHTICPHRGNDEPLTLIAIICRERLHHHPVCLPVPRGNWQQQASDYSDSTNQPVNIFQPGATKEQQNAGE